MYAAISRFSGEGTGELFDLIEQQKSTVEDLMRSVAGFVSVTTFRTDTEGHAVYVCRDRDGIDESVRRMEAWLEECAPHVGVSAPVVTHGPVGFHAAIVEPRQALHARWDDSPL